MEPKKRSMGASEGDEQARSAWRKRVVRLLDPKRLIFVDECGTNDVVALGPLYRPEHPRRARGLLGRLPVTGARRT